MAILSKPFWKRSALSPRWDTLSGFGPANPMAALANRVNLLRVNLLPVEHVLAGGQPPTLPALRETRANCRTRWTLVAVHGGHPERACPVFSPAYAGAGANIEGLRWP